VKRAAQFPGGWEQHPRSYRMNCTTGRFLALALSLFVLRAEDAARGQDRIGLDKRLQATEEALAKVDNYTAIFHRIERVEGKLLPEEITFLKFKRPLKIYMRWISPSEGQESLYVRGANNNKIRAHGTGIAKFITVNLDPSGGLAMENSRHPITEAGLENLVKRIGSDLRRGLQTGEVAAKDHGERVVYGRKTQEIEGVLPKDASKGYYCYRCVVNLDAETKMPIRTQIFDWDGQLVELYGYEKLRLNPGLTDKDFEPKNPAYHF
jgi:outer membrane lipoprotein-sorting protein